MLLVEGSPKDAARCARTLAKAGLALDIRTVGSTAEAERLLRRERVDIVITAHDLPDGGADDTIRLVLDLDPETPCIVLTGVLDDRAASALLSLGAFDYIQKDRPARLAAVVHHALQQRHGRVRQREVADRLIRTMAHMSDGFVALDRAWRYTYVNRRAGELLGARPEALIGRHAWPAFPKPGRLVLQQACQRALVEQGPAVIPEPFRVSGRWLESRIIPAPDGVTIFLQDVTDRREAADALQASEHRFRTVVESAASGIILVDGGGRIVYLNQAVEQQLGYTREDLVGEPIERLVPHRFRGAHPALRAQFSGSHEARRMGAGRDLFGLHKDGHEIPVEVGLMPLAGNDGSAVLVTIVDITGRKRAETDRDALARRLLDLQESERRALARELHDEVGQLLTGLKLMLEGRGAMGGPEEMEHLVREALGRVRDVSMNLRPPMLDDLGLLPTLQWLVLHFHGHTGITVGFTHGGLDRRFAQAVETAAFRIAQEGLTNVARHAAVQQAQLDARVIGDRLTIVIHDVGAGFDQSMSSSIGATQGLRGMHERARLLGGELHIASRPGGGTQIRAEIPVEPGSGGEPGS